MAKGKWVKTAVCIFAFLFVLCYVLEFDSWARVGGGSSSGSRGSRSYSSPSRPSPGPSQSVGTPTKPTPPSQQPIQQPGGGFFSGMLGGLAGGFLGSHAFQKSRVGRTRQRYGRQRYGRRRHRLHGDRTDCRTPVPVVPLHKEKAGGGHCAVVLSGHPEAMGSTYPTLVRIRV